MKQLLLILALSAGIFTSAAAADKGAPPQCSPSKEGEVACMGDKLCECQHVNASLMKGTPEGYRWDCGINRPNCIDYNKTEEVKPYDGPSSIGLPSNTNINNRSNSSPVNTNGNTNSNSNSNTNTNNN